MKRKLSIFLIMTLLILTSCNKNVTDNNPKNNGEDNTISKLTIKDYFPFAENIKYEYAGEGNEFAAYTLYVDFINKNRIQTRENNGGTEVVRVLEYKDGQLKELFSRGETYFRENFTGTEKNEGEILLKEPLEKGTGWTTGDNIKKTITNVDVEIKTPSGEYKAIEVTSEGGSSKTISYYAKNIGLIKVINSGEGYEVTSTLSKIEKDAPLVQKLKVFYPDIDADNINSESIDLLFKTNEETKDVIEKTIKGLGKDRQILSTNVKINNLRLDNDVVKIDFSKELVTEMNAGSGYESMILQSITNTLGIYYSTEKVYITVDGKPYESGHIMMKEGEAFKVNLDNVKE